MEVAEKEWIKLIKEAKKLGLTIAEIREFLSKGEHLFSNTLQRQKP